MAYSPDFRHTPDLPHPPDVRLARCASARSVGRRWRSYLAVLGVLVAAAVVFAVVPGVPAGRAYPGLVLGGLAILLTISLVDLRKPPVDRKLAEQWSIDGLRKLPGWQVLDALHLEGHDVDHAVVAPSAVLAVQAHHVPAGAAFGADALRHEVYATDRSAARMRRFLKTQGLDEVVVVPVLMMSGPGAPALAEGSSSEDGVQLVDGTRPGQWMRQFADPRLSVAVRRELASRLQQQVGDQPAVEVPSLRIELWRQFRAGVSDERIARSRAVPAPVRRRTDGAVIIGPAAASAPAAAGGSST